MFSAVKHFGILFSKEQQFLLTRAQPLLLASGVLLVKSHVASSGRTAMQKEEVMQNVAKQPKYGNVRWLCLRKAALPHSTGQQRRAVAGHEASTFGLKPTVLPPRRRSSVLAAGGMHEAQLALKRLAGHTTSQPCCRKRVFAAKILCVSASFAKASQSLLPVAKGNCLKWLRFYFHRIFKLRANLKTPKLRSVQQYYSYRSCNENRNVYAVIMTIAQLKTY
ncbi:hypothetical protein NPIL_317461 [Nephila pilipes]|uniref:Uncharacterized protein n=1 Tax=Nephila pilipes TaxID=299642 RepID=A0A8X6JE65_NEPPI|nr:hypothetical protein NPIL_317461 [Nephila pilipes]